MSRQITVSQSVCHNTFVFEIHEQYRTRLSVLMSRTEAIALCDKLRALLSDPPVVPIEGPKLTIFPADEQPMELRIAPIKF